MLGLKIRALRNQLGFSQEKLAEKAELHPNYVGELERGEENVSLDTLMKIARALKVRVRDLISDV